MFTNTTLLCHFKRRRWIWWSIIAGIILYCLQGPNSYEIHSIKSDPRKGQFIIDNKILKDDSNTLRWFNHEKPSDLGDGIDHEPGPSHIGENIESESDDEELETVDDYTSEEDSLKKGGQIDIGIKGPSAIETVSMLEKKERTNDSMTSHLEILEFLEINKERKKTIVNACRSFMKTKNRMKTKMVRTRHPRAQMFTVSPKKRIAWCRTPKVATTTWGKVFLQLYGVKKFGHYHSQLKRTEKKFLTYSRKRSIVKTMKNKLRKYRSFMAARHPIDRLWSAYRDKIAHKKIRIKNVNGVRKPTFSIFLTFIAMNNPTGYDRHWKPNWVICNPCIYKYDYIVKMESFDRDSGALLSHIGAEEIAKINHLNGHKKKYVSKSVNYPQILKHVKAWVLEEILDIFELDFTMFDYDMQPFLDILKKKQEKEILLKRAVETKNQTSI